MSHSTSERAHREWLGLAADIAWQATDTILFDSDQKVIKDFCRDVKISADLKLNDFIVRHLVEHSNLPVFSEEIDFSWETAKENQYYWIVDPLDGSLNFSRGIPIFCISLALWHGNEPVLGVIFDFNHNELYTGLVGHGAWLNGHPIEVGRAQNKQDAVLCTGFPVGTDFTEPALIDFVRDIQAYKKIRLLGSAALSLAYVASGRADAYKENDIAIWDIAAGIAVVKAAGGRVRMGSSQKQNRLHVIASNKFLL